MAKTLDVRTTKEAHSQSAARRLLPPTAPAIANRIAVQARWASGINESPRMIAQRQQFASTFSTHPPTAKADATRAPQPPEVHHPVGAPLQRMQEEGEGVETQWFVRWYSFDGITHVPRRMGLPVGWIHWPEKYRGKDVYVSIEDFAKLEISRQVNQVSEQVRQVVTEHTPLLANLAQQVDRHDLEIENLEQVQHEFLSLQVALNNYLTKGSTFLKTVLTVAGIAASIAGAVILSYVTLPAWLVGAIDGISFLYGIYVLYRWLSSELLPGYLKFALVAINALVMAGTAGPILGEAVAYLLNLTDTLPFQHIKLAAIPFAMGIELIITKVIEKVNAMRQAYNRQHNLGNDLHRD